MEIVDIRTFDNVHLKGLFAPANSDKVVLIIPGINGNFIENDFFVPICQKLSSAGINCLCANMRDSFHVSMSLYPHNAIKPKKIGGTYSDFEECLYDIDAWINYLLGLGFKKIDLVSHCFGANKIIYYYNKCNDKTKFIDNIVFIAPANLIKKIQDYPDYESIMKTALENVENGERNKLVDSHMFYKTSESFIRLMNSDSANNLPLNGGSYEQFEKFRNINNKISVIYGTSDQYVAPYISKISEVASKESDVNIIKIDEADHLFYEKEKELADTLCGELKRRYNLYKKR